MRGKPTITEVEIIEFEDHLQDVGLDPTGAIPTYRPGSSYARSAGALRIYTDVGIVGEYAGWQKGEAGVIKELAGRLIGRNALERELIYEETKLATRQIGRLGMGVVDVALWDIAGKYYDAPIYELLGGYRKKLPAYASTMNGGSAGGLHSPEAFADFAEECLELGYPAYKIHPWPGGPIAKHVAAVLEVGKRVGGKMDLMIDPFCYYRTFGEALKVGRACDEAGYFWYEDPYRDGGISQFGHRKLRQLIKTPILQCEHLRSLEPHVDFMVAEATDFVRGDVGYDGITATMKVAHAAEGLGIDIEYHGAGPAQRHCMAATRNSNYYEMVWVHPKLRSTMMPIYKGGYHDGLDDVDQDGCVTVPEGPGLGVEYDWEFITHNEKARLKIG